MAAITSSSDTRASAGWRSSASLRRRDRLDRAHRVALDARDLHQPAHRVAREPEVVLHRDLGGHQRLARAPAVGLGQRRRGHRRRHADLGLASAERSRDRGALLEQAADLRRDGQEAHDADPLRERLLVPKARWQCSTAGMTPAAPLVGAVTTRPNAAFSSLTARARALTTASTRLKSVASRSDGVEPRWVVVAGGRRPSVAPPPRAPAASREGRLAVRPPAGTRGTWTRASPASTARRPARVSASGRQRRSFSCDHPPDRPAGLVAPAQQVGGRVDRDTAAPRWSSRRPRRPRPPRTRRRPSSRCAR